MENSNRSNVEILESVLKAGIPLAIALGGFLFARIVRKPSDCEIEEKIMVLRTRLEDIRNQENQLEMQFQFYQEKDQQVFLELQNRFELFTTEVSSSREVFKTMEMMVTEVSGLLKRSCSENQKLYKRVNKLLRITDTQCRLLRKRSLQMEARELEIPESRDALVVKDGQIRKMEDEIKELKQKIEEMQIEKNQLLDNLIIAEEEDVAIGNHKSEIVVKADDDEDEMNELVYLRKCNAFLRHELMRKNQEQEVQAEEDGHLDVGFGQIAADSESDGDDVGGSATTSSQVQVHVHSKRQKLIARLRKWVEGTEKPEQNFDVEENKCFRRHLVSHGDKVLLSSRKSCSSA